MQYRSEYDLYVRKTVKGKKIFYYRIRDEFGNRMSGRSTRQTSLSRAHQWMAKQKITGSILIGKDITFGVFAENWWVWDKCEYLKKVHVRGDRASRGYADTNLSYLKNHILPYFGNMKLSQITPLKVDKWRVMLAMDRIPKPLSRSTVKNILLAFRLMLEEAVWQKYISINPAKGIKMKNITHIKKTSVTQKEVKDLFDKRLFHIVWRGNIYHYTINLLASCTGIRMGEWKR